MILVLENFWDQSKKVNGSSRYVSCRYHRFISDRRHVRTTYSLEFAKTLYPTTYPAFRSKCLKCHSYRRSYRHCLCHKFVIVVVVCVIVVILVLINFNLKTNSTNVNPTGNLARRIIDKVTQFTYTICSLFHLT